MSYRPFSFGFRNRRHPSGDSGCFPTVITIFFIVLILGFTGSSCEKKHKEESARLYKEKLIAEIKEEEANASKSDDTEKQVEVEEKRIEIEKPYIGMSEQYIGHTKWGRPDYSSYVVGGTSYLFYADGGYAYLVTVQHGEVSMIQKFKNGKIIWSETETGMHTLPH